MPRDGQSLTLTDLVAKHCVANFLRQVFRRDPK